MKALVLVLVLLAAQTIDAGAYVVCNATPHRAACLGPRVGTNHGWRGWGWYRWRGPYGWGGPSYAGPPGLYGWPGPYAGPYFRPAPYF
jgi:hypothetical protein